MVGLHICHTIVDSMGAEGTSYRNGSGATSDTPTVRPANGSNGGNKKNGPSASDGSLKKTKFEGKIDGLKGHVYDITGYKSQDLFEKTTKEIVDHIGTGVNQNQLCFVHIFLILGTLYNCYQKGDFPTGLVMKKCPNHSSFKIIS